MQAKSDNTMVEQDSTKVGHCKRDDVDVYIGRGRGGACMHDVEIGERGWLGNPYRLDDGYSRERSVELFANDLLERIDSDPEFRKALYELKGATLGCWCRSVDDDGPGCHGDVLKRAIDAMQYNGENMQDESQTRDEENGKRTIIAGTRNFGRGMSEQLILGYVDDVIDESGFDVGEVVSGTADGADEAGELWAEENDVPVERFPADWNNIDHPDAIVREGKYGKYDARAGHRRNQQMAEYGDQLIAIWDGKSSGTESMIEKGRRELGDENVHVHVYD